MDHNVASTAQFVETNRRHGVDEMFASLASDDLEESSIDVFLVRT
jgi:hypothetical protein